MLGTAVNARISRLLFDFRKDFRDDFHLRLGALTAVAQTVCLLFRRLVVGGLPLLQVANLRHSRLSVCATARCQS